MINMICPYCKKEINPQKEDNSTFTDKGTYGGIYYICPECEEVLEEL